MNERIQELALQASLGPALLLHHWGTIDALTDSEQDELTKIEKFAELIVKESIAMCDELLAAYLKYRKESDDSQDKNIYAEGEAACDIIKYKMKKHFGVEE